jgi:hypothetical protein
MYEHIGTHATTVRFGNHRHMVRYHETDVVITDGTRTVLDSGEFRTPTTKRRINQSFTQFNLPFHLFQHAGEWYVDTPRGPVDFSDSMVLYS